MLFAKINWLFLIPLVLFSVMQAQVSRGKVFEGLKLKSELLNREVRYSVYLPFDYDSSNRYYPVVYLLHGYTDDDTGWLQFGEAHLLADQAIAENRIPPMILIMPDAGLSWYLNNYDNSVPYEDFFIREFMPFVEQQYRIRHEKRYRGVAGLSMGGFGSLVYALKHPDLFAACAAFSPAIYTKDEIIAFSEERWQHTERLVYGPDPKGEQRLTSHLLSNNPIYILDTADLDQIRSVRIYIDCGDDDFLYKGNSTFHIKLRDLKVNHEYRVRDGGHHWSYWRSGLLEGLKFIGTSFHQP